MANDDFDLPRPTDAVPSATSAVINDNSKVLDYVINGEGVVVNRAGGELITLDEAIARINWSYVGLFADGVTFTSRTDFAVDAVGTQWVYNGPYPFVATAGTVPSAPSYQAVRVNSHGLLSDINATGGHDAIYPRRVSSIASAKLLELSSNTIGSQLSIDSFLWVKTANSQTPSGIAPSSDSYYFVTDDGARYDLQATDGRIYPEAVGGLFYLLQNPPTSGAAIQLGIDDYNIVDLYFLDGVALNPLLWRGNTTNNIKIYGSGMPEYSDDGTRFVSGSGTVIQGALVNWADSFECYDLGVDCGSYVVDTLNAGESLDGFVPGTLKTLAEIASEVELYYKNIHFGNIKTLLKDPVNGQPATYKHSILFEHVFSGSYSGHIECRGGYFGFVNKSQHISGNAVPFLHGQLLGATYIHKSDQYSESKHNKILGYKIGREQDAMVPSGLWEAQSGVGLSDYAVGDITGVNCSELFTPSAAATERMTDITIGSIQGGLMAGSNGMYISDLFDRVNIGTHNFVNVVNGIVTDAGCTQVDLGSGNVRIASANGYDLAGGVTHGNIDGQQITGWTVKNSGYVPNPELISNSDGSGSGVLDTLFTVPITYEGNWAASGFYPLIVNAWGGKLTFSGFVAAPSNNGTGTLFTLPAGLRPKRQEIFFVNSLISGVWTHQYSIAFNTDGTVSTDAAGVTDVNFTGIELRYNA